MGGGKKFGGKENIDGVEFWVGQGTEDVKEGDCGTYIGGVGGEGKKRL